MVAWMRQHFSGLSRNTFLLALSSLFADISTEMLYPVLPVFLTQVLHASGSIVGLVDGFALATQNIVQGFSGAVSDHLQRRKPVALVGYLMAAAAKPLMGMATVWQALFAARLLDRIGTGTRSAPRDALVASSVAAQDRGKAFGLEGLGDNAGAFLGPLFALLLLHVLHLDLRTIFYVAVIPGLLAVLMVLLVTETQAAVAAKSKIDIHLGLLPRRYWNYLLATALFCAGSSSNAFLILQTRDVGATLETTILIYAGFNLVAALISYPAGALSDRLGRRNVLLVGFAVFLITYVGFALSRNVVLIGGLFVLYGLFQGIFRAVGKALASDLVPEELRASGVGWYSTTVGLMQLLASIAAGLLWDGVSHASVFFLGALFAFIGSVSLMILMPGQAEDH